MKNEFTLITYLLVPNYSDICETFHHQLPEPNEMLIKLINGHFADTALFLSI